MSTLILLMPLFCAAAPPVQTSRTPETMLYVRTTPEGAEITMDGRPLGTSPGLFKVPAGVRRIVVELEGHEPNGEEVTIQAGQIKRMTFKLTQRHALSADDPKAVAALKQSSAYLTLDDRGRVIRVMFRPAAATDASFEHLAGLPRLQAVELPSTAKLQRYDVTDAGLRHLKGLTDLKVLDLCQSKVTDAGLVHLKGLGNLEYLCLAFTGEGVTGRGMAHLAGLDNLKALDLRATQVTDDGLRHLSRLPNLRRLDLTRTRVTDAAVHDLNSFDHLEWLALPDVSIADVRLMELRSLRRLRRLYLPSRLRRLVTEEGVAKLQQALPNTQIIGSEPSVAALSGLQGTDVLDAPVAEEPRKRVGKVVAQLLAALGNRDIEKLEALFLSPADTPAGRNRRAYLDDARAEFSDPNRKDVRLLVQSVQIKPAADSEDQLLAVEMLTGIPGPHGEGWFKQGQKTLEFRITPTKEGGRIAEVNLVRATMKGLPSASAAPADEDLQRRSVAKKVSDFPKTVDLSTPESACAAYHRASARMDAQAVVDLSWVKIDPAEMERFWEQAGPEDLAIYNPARLEAEIVEVWVYREKLADVISRLAFPPGKGRHPYSSRGFGLIDGQWKNLGEDRLPSLEAAVAGFLEKKDRLWEHFRKIEAALHAEPARAGRTDRKARRTAPVAVTVTSGGKPVEGATVMFIPRAPDGSPASGQTDAAGRAVLTTTELGDGVIPGTYGVTISKVVTEQKGAGTGLRHLVPRRFAEPETSGLTVEVAESANDFPFDLSGVEQPHATTGAAEGGRR